MATGRKRIEPEKKRHGNCVIIGEANYVGNNRQVKCLCDCGQTFTTSFQQFKGGLTLMCPKCRKEKTKKAREAKRLEKIDLKATKYTLMDPARTSIIRGSCGIHSYFSKIKARTAAKVINAVVVPLKEAEIIQNTSTQSIPGS